MSNCTPKSNKLGKHLVLFFFNLYTKTEKKKEVADTNEWDSCNKSTAGGQNHDSVLRSEKALWHLWGVSLPRGTVPL